MARMNAFQQPFFKPMWRRMLIVLLGLILGLALFVAGYAYSGTVLCAAAFWLGYELLIVFDVDTGRKKK